MLEAITGLSSVTSSGGDPLDLVRGAIGGAFIIGVAYLAGIAVIRRSFEAAGALLVVAAAGAMEFFALGLLPTLSAAKMVFVQSIFAASVMIFLSSAIDAARRNAVLGGIIFTGALIILGMGAAHAFAGLPLAGLLRYAFWGVAGFTGLLVLLQAFRGDRGAQLLLPGAAIALSSPWLAGFLAAEAAAITPHALFSFGVLAASLIALTHAASDAGALVRPMGDGGAAEAGSVFSSGDEMQRVDSVGFADPVQQQVFEPTYVSDNQLAEVLDYAGISVLDWSEEGAHHSEGFSSLFAEAGQALSPEVILDNARQSDRSRLEQELYGAGKGDGAFDISFSTRGGKNLRLRGARAVDASGQLERLVVFAEPSVDEKQPSLLEGKWGAGAGAVAGASLAAASQSLQKNTALHSVAKRSSEKLSTDEKTSAEKSIGEPSEVSDASSKKAGLQTVGLQAPAISRSAFASSVTPSATVEATQNKAVEAAPAAVEVTGIAAAIKQGQLRAAFQPIVSIDGEDVRGFEALLRAKDAEKDFNGMSTEEIVAKAEAEGQGVALADMMLDASAAFLSAKLKSGEYKDLFVAFNVSYGQLRAEGFVEKTAQAIKEYNLPPRALVLELTESEAVTDDEAAQKIFAGLKAVGAALAFDDFGAGFSSLSNLRKFEFDYLKVDKSFVEKVTDDKQASKIISALAGLGGDLGMTVIAEGVSSKEIAKAVHKCGCRFGQGFYYGKPELPPEGHSFRAQMAPDTVPTGVTHPSLSTQRSNGANLTVQGRVKAHNLR